MNGKTLVVFYSWTGTSRLLAQTLAGELGCPLGEIVEVRSREGVTGILRSVADSLLRLRPKIRYEGPLPGEFEQVILVSPIWMYRLAGPMRSFASRFSGSLRQVAVVSVMTASGAPNAVAELSRLLGRRSLLSTAFTAREIEDGSCAGRLLAFGKAAQATSSEGFASRPAILSPRAM